MTIAILVTVVVLALMLALMRRHRTSPRRDSQSDPGYFGADGSDSGCNPSDASSDSGGCDGGGGGD